MAGSTSVPHAGAGGGTAPPAGPRRGRLRLRFRSRARSRAAAGLLFLLPTLLAFGLFSWWPILRGLGLSFQTTNLVTSTWVGFANFTALFDDPLLGTAVRNTLLYGAIALVIGFPLPLVMAVFMAELKRAGGLLRVLVYLPVVLPPVVSALLWKWFYDPDSGLFNHLLGLVGLGPFSWLQSSGSALPSLVVEATWAGMGGTALIYLAALTSVPGELYEAAEVDGAPVWRRLWHITLPRLRGVVLILLLLQIIGTLQVFTEPFVLTDGGPDNATVTVLLLIYRYAFTEADYGRATALSLLLAVVLATVSAVYLKATKKWSDL